MKFPLQIQFKDIEKSDLFYNAIWDHVDRLEKFYDRIVSCHVVVSQPHRHKTQGNIYHIQVRLYLPGEDVFISTEPEKNAAHEDFNIALRDVFDVTRKRLEDYVRKMRGFVKEKQVQSSGKVLRIFSGDRFGFIVTPDNREIYFHENSVLNHRFDSLQIGDEVRFSEEMGEKGPQVTSMSPIGQARHLERA